MNRCDISEEETTKALHALYQLPLPESQNNLQSHAGRTAPGVTSADVLHLNQNHQNLNSDAMPNRERKKHISKETPNTASHSAVVQTSNFTKNPREEIMKGKSLDETNHRLLETNMMKKSNPRPGDELKEKHLNGGMPFILRLKFVCGCYILCVNFCNMLFFFGYTHYAGDLKPKKLKNKRGPDHYGYVTTKKIKTEAAVDSVGISSSTGLPTRAGGKDLQKHSGHCDLKDPKPEPKERLLISVKKQRDCTQVSSDSGSMDLKTSEGSRLYAKKRKLKDWQDSQNHLETLRSNGNYFPDNKVSLEESSTKGDDMSNQKGTVTRIILPASRANPADKSVKKDLQHRAKVASKLTIEDIELLKKDLGSEQFSMGAASSSSKVSDSRKRASLQEVKGSPVESVSSSPMRTSNVDKLSPTRRGNSEKDDANNGGLGNLERIRSRSSAKGEALGAFHPDSVVPSLPDFHDNDSRCKSGAKAESGAKPSSVFENNHLINSDAETLGQQHQHKEDRVNTKHRNVATSSHKSGKGSSLRSKDKDRSTGHNFQKVTLKVSDPSGEQDLDPKKILNEAQCGLHQLAPHQIDAKHNVSDERSIKSNKDEKSVDKKGSRKRATESKRESLTKIREHDGSDAKLQQNSIQVFGGESEIKRDPTQVESRSGKSRFNPQGPQPLSGSLKGSGFDVRAVDTSGDGDVHEVLKQPGKAVDPKGAHLSVGNPLPNRGVRDLSGSSTVKRDTSSQTATSTLKEAESLRGYADNLKV